MFTIESYRGRPEGAGRPPRNWGNVWPTGFNGGGWLVRDAAGAVVFAHAWRVFCIEYVEDEEAADRRPLLAKVIDRNRAS